MQAVFLKYIFLFALHQLLKKCSWNLVGVGFVVVLGVFLIAVFRNRKYLKIYIE